MKVDTHHLSGWKHFCATCLADSESFCSPKTRATFNCFYARYRLALKFEAVHAHRYSERAVRGYDTVGLRLLAAYSAAELLGEATDEKVVGWEIKDPKLAVTLGKSLSRATGDSNGIFSGSASGVLTGGFMRCRRSVVAYQPAGVIEESSTERCTPPPS